MCLSLPIASLPYLQDALLLLTIAFPMFACTDPTLVSKTEQKVINALCGKYVSTLRSKGGGLYML